MNKPYRVTFVCTGNICRSPMAESILRRHLHEAGLADRVEVDSSGTEGWHAGKPADERTDATLRHAGYDTGHAARHFDPAWFATYDLIIALDTGHLHTLRQLAPNNAAAEQVRLLREFDPEPTADPNVPDPYYGDHTDFDHVRSLIESATPGLINHIRHAHRHPGPPTPNTA